MFGRIIKNVHLELSSYCNLACPLCTRTFGGEVNPNVQEEHLSLESFQSIFTPQNLKTISRVYACGTAGDPLMSPYSLDILRYIRKSNPRCELVIHTNGAYRTGKYYQELAEILGKYGSVVFAIDGLEDTNAIYRVNAKWHVLMNNVKAFIAAGGKARWQWILFDHTSHQLETAKKLAEELGFVEFFTIYNNRKADGLSKKIHGTESPNAHITPTKIQCPVLKDKQIYVASTGEISPCCFVGGLTHQDSVRRKFMLGDLSEKERNHLVFNPNKPICFKHCGVDDSGTYANSIFDPYVNQLASTGKGDVPRISPRKK